MAKSAGRQAYQDARKAQHGDSFPQADLSGRSTLVQRGPPLSGDPPSTEAYGAQSARSIMPETDMPSDALLAAVRDIPDTPESMEQYTRGVLEAALQGDKDATGSTEDAPAAPTPVVTPRDAYENEHAYIGPDAQLSTTASGSGRARRAPPRRARQHAPAYRRNVRENRKLSRGAFDDELRSHGWE